MAGAVVAALSLAVVVGVFNTGAGAADEDGQAIFDQQCKGCHTIGGGKLAGPDLQGLAGRRERAWVERFIREPDKVIASGDPIAKQLVEEYGVAMPNLGVSDAQLAALVAFLGYADPEPEPTSPPPATRRAASACSRGPTASTPVGHRASPAIRWPVSGRSAAASSGRT